MITAIYPGTYDPVTNGHVDVITRAARVFDRVVVGVVGNPHHKTPMFDVPERVAFLEAALEGVENVEVDVFSELVVDFARRWDARAIVKGLRVVSDFESEMSFALMNRALSEVDTFFLMSDQKYSFVSSSLVKEVFFLGGEVAALVPEPVLRLMAEKRISLQRR